MAEGVEDLDESIMCSVCLEEFKTPKVLSCGHSFCLEPCLRSITSSKKNRKIFCPLCRCKISLPKSGHAQDFPTNFSLQAILESKKRKRSSTSTYTTLHNVKKHITDVPINIPMCTHLQSAQFYCERCEQFLCIECAECFHSDSIHSIIAKDTALEHARLHSERMVREKLASLKQRVATLDDQLEEARISSFSYNMQVSILEHEVKMYMAAARQAINEREQQYLRTVGEQGKADKAVFETFTRTWECTKSNDQKLMKPLEEILLQVQAGDLTSMDQVMNVGPIDISCSAMIEEMKTKLRKSPPFEIVNESDRLPKLRRT